VGSPHRHGEFLDRWRVMCFGAEPRPSREDLREFENEVRAEAAAIGASYGFPERPGGITTATTDPRRSPEETRHGAVEQIRRFLGWS
jgi:hypothetical protein